MYYVIIYNSSCLHEKSFFVSAVSSVWISNTGSICHSHFTSSWQLECSITYSSLCGKNDFECRVSFQQPCVRHFLSILILPDFTSTLQQAAVAAESHPELRAKCVFASLCRSWCSNHNYNRIAVKKKQVENMFLWMCASTGRILKTEKGSNKLTLALLANWHRS